MHRAYPLFFVFLWSTGFIGAKFGLPHAEPLSFLLTRYGLVIVLMTAIALATRAPWPQKPGDWGAIAFSGILVHGVYLGGVFVAIKGGLPAGTTALVVGMQPLLTAVGAGFFLGETVSRQQWLGLILGVLGVALVVSGKVAQPDFMPRITPAVVALFGITAGTLYQKRYCPRFDLRTGAVIQFAPTALVTGLLVSQFETYHIEWTGEFLFALGWLVLVLSIGAISLLNLLIRNGSAVNVASLFYLTPPCTALIAWAGFGETLSAPALLGMLIAVGGVYLANRRRP